VEWIASWPDGSYPSSVSEWEAEGTPINSSRWVVEAPGEYALVRFPTARTSFATYNVTGAVGQTGTECWVVPLADYGLGWALAMKGHVSTSVIARAAGYRTGQVIIEMLKDGKWEDITGKTVKIIVGERLKLRGNLHPGPVNPNDVSWVWDIQGKAIERFVMDRYRLYNKIGPQPTEGYPDKLEAGDKKRREVSFFWSDGSFGGTSLAVKLSGSWHGAKFEPSTVTSNVFKPTSHIAIVDTRLAVLSVTWNNPERRWEMQLQSTWGGPQGPGIAIDDANSRVTLPQWYRPPPRNFAHAAFLQLYSANHEAKRNAHQPWTPDWRCTDCLDEEFPYRENGRMPSRTRSCPGFSDSPLIPLTWGVSRRVHDHAKVWLMFSPAGADSDWLPLRTFTWSWWGQANEAANGTSAGVPMARHVSATEQQDAAEYPTWSCNTANETRGLWPF